MFRQSTRLKAVLAEQRQQEVEQQRQMIKKKTKIEYYQLSQEELLEEARLTEEENIKSLESYQRLELERKKARIVKHTYKGPIIRYHSMSMPLIEELPDDWEGLCVEQDGEELVEKIDKSSVRSNERCSRNFITFTDEATFKDYFVKVKPKVPQRNFCPITRLPARYYDPVTQMAFANLQAFKVLRDAYYQQLEQKGDRKQPEVAAWIEWRKQWRAQRQQMMAPAVSRPVTVQHASTSS
jgi:vacuolar protein sorting-associated protein 72